MGSNRIMQFQQDVFKTIIDQIILADQKAAIILAGVAILAGVLYDKLPYDDFAGCLRILWLLVVTVHISIIVILLSAVLPRYKDKGGHKNGSLIFYGDIKYRTQDQLIMRYRKLEDKEIMDDLSVQIHKLSKIASRKFTLIQFAIVLLFIFLIGILLLTVGEYNGK